MALVHTCRSASRSGRPHFVPGGLACAASGRRAVFAPTSFSLSTTLKIVSAALASPVHRLSPISA